MHHRRLCSGTALRAAASHRLSWSGLLCWGACKKICTKWLYQYGEDTIRRLLSTLRAGSVLSIAYRSLMASCLYIGSEGTIALSSMWDSEIELLEAISMMIPCKGLPCPGCCPACAQLFNGDAHESTDVSSHIGYASAGRPQCKHRCWGVIHQHGATTSAVNDSQLLKQCHGGVQLIVHYDNNRNLS